MPDPQELQDISRLVMQLHATQEQRAPDWEAVHSICDELILDYFDKRDPPEDGRMTVREVYNMSPKWCA